MFFSIRLKSLCFRSRSFLRWYKVTYFLRYKSFYMMSRKTEGFSAFDQDLDNGTCSSYPFCPFLSVVPLCYSCRIWVVIQRNPRYQMVAHIHISQLCSLNTWVQWPKLSFSDKTTQNKRKLNKHPCYSVVTLWKKYHTLTNFHWYILYIALTPGRFLLFMA